MRNWEDDATKAFKGKVVQSIRWMTEDEQKDMYWDRSCPIIEFTDGSFLFPSQDDEGNAPGAMYTSDRDISILPVGV
jgi:hypothetical protein